MITFKNNAEAADLYIYGEITLSDASLKFKRNVMKNGDLNIYQFWRKCLKDGYRS